MSGGVKANWHLAELVADEDPFSSVTYSTGMTIDLTASEDDLAEQMVRLLMREGRIGVDCELKDDGQDCLTCRESTQDPEDPLSRLCRLGKDERTVEIACAEKATLRRGAIAEFIDHVEEMSELDDMDDALAELLTAVGA